MDFQKEFNNSIRSFSSLEGLIFVDPDGEAILYEAPIADPFDLQLAGAKMPILMAFYNTIGIEEQPRFMELQFEKHFIISVGLIDDYSITAIGNDRLMKARVKNHLARLAIKFNREIA